MLQKSQTSDGVSFAPLEGGESGGLNELVTFAVGYLRRQYLVIAFATAFAVAAGIIYLRVTPPIFNATATVLIDRQKSAFVQQQGLLTDAPIDTAAVESQLEILRSKAIASGVIKNLQMASDPEFTGSGGGWLGSLFAISGSELSPSDLRSTSDPSDAAIEAFERRLSVSRVGISWVLEITFSSNKPDRAAQIANAVANAYVVDQLEAKYQANRAASEWLRARLQQLGAESSAAQHAVEAFKEQNNIITADGKPVDEQKVVDLNGRLVAARTQTSDSLARLNRLQAIISAGSNDATLDAAVSEIANTPITTTLRQQYLELSRREAEWSARFGRDHLAVVSLRNRMQEVRTSMLDELRRFAETTRNDYEVLKQRQEEIEKQLAQAVTQSQTTGQAQVTLRELESKATGYRNLHDSFLQHYMGSAQQETFPISEARILSPASPPPSKSKPKSLLVLALSLIGGVGLGCGLGMLRELTDRVFRTGEQLESELQTPCIALVPLLKAGLAKQPPRGSIDKTGSTRESRVFRTVVDAPLSSFTEAIRAIKLAVDLHTGSRLGKVIGFTSALPNEGKSTISASLAALITQVGGRVILVDCDLRNPSLSRMISPHASVGIVEVIAGRISKKEAILRDVETKISFLPAVKKTPIFHTSEVLASEAMRKLFDELRAEYDYVVVDLPPLAPIIDVRATTHLVDSYLLVVEWGRTRIDVVEHSLRTSPRIYEALMGAVLNKTDLSSMKRYDSYRGELYQNVQFARYGYTE